MEASWSYHSRIRSPYKLPWRSIALMIAILSSEVTSSLLRGVDKLLQRRSFRDRRTFFVADSDEAVANRIVLRVESSGFYAKSPREQSLRLHRWR